MSETIKPRGCASGDPCSSCQCARQPAEKSPEKAAEKEPASRGCGCGCGGGRR